MKPIQILWVFLLCFLSMNAFAESVHEIRYTKGGLKYKAVLVDDDKEITMRVRFTDAEKKVRLVDVTYVTLTGSSAGEAYKILKAKTFRFASKKGNSRYKPVNLVFMGKKTPYILFNLNDRNAKTPLITYRKLTKGKVTESFLRQFFYSRESELADLKKMLEVGTANTNANRFTTLHLIVLANTKISDIGAGCKVDEKNIVKEFQAITKTLGVSLKTYLIDDSDFNKAKTLATLKGLSPKPNDIVFFVYRGHGFRWSDQSETWPQMDLRTSNYSKISKNTSLGLMEAFNIIRKKGARLNITLADCCNNDIGINRRTETPINSLATKGLYDAKKLEQLFLKSKGNIISCAASPDQYSWVNSRKGGFYTVSFLEALREETNSKNKLVPNWKNIMNNTIEGANRKTAKCRECTKQTAKFYSNVK